MDLRVRGTDQGCTVHESWEDVRDPLVGRMAVLRSISGGSSSTQRHHDGCHIAQPGKAGCDVGERTSPASMTGGRESFRCQRVVVAGQFQGGVVISNQTTFESSSSISWPAHRSSRVDAREDVGMADTVADCVVCHRRRIRGHDDEVLDRSVIPGDRRNDDPNDCQFA